MRSLIETNSLSVLLIEAHPMKKTIDISKTTKGINPIDGSVVKEFLD